MPPRDWRLRIEDTLAAPLRSPRVAFLAGAAAILAASWLALHGPAAQRHPQLVAAAVAFDLTVTATVLAWLLLVRRGGAGPLTLSTVFAAGAALAVRWVPAAPRPAALLLAAAGELAFLGALAWRAVGLQRSWRALGGALPVEEALRVAAREALGRSRIVDALATEAAVLWLELASWRRRPDVPRGAVAFACHRRVAHGAVVVAVLLAGVAETAAVHLLLARWSERWAWVATGLGVYGMLWLVGDLRAVVLRPSYLAGGALVARVGLRWRGTIPLDRIEAVCLDASVRGHHGAARLSPLGAANLYLHLREPVELEGLFGRRRRSALLGLRVDEPEALAAALQAG